MYLKQNKSKWLQYFKMYRNSTRTWVYNVVSYVKRDRHYFSAEDSRVDSRQKICFTKNSAALCRRRLFAAEKRQSLQTSTATIAIHFTHGTKTAAFRSRSISSWATAPEVAIYFPQVLTCRRWFCDIFTPAAASATWWRWDCYLVLSMLYLQYYLLHNNYITFGDLPDQIDTFYFVIAKVVS